MLSGEKNICVRGRSRVRGTKVLANDDQGWLYASEGATIVGGVMMPPYAVEVRDEERDRRRAGRFAIE